MKCVQCGAWSLIKDTRGTRRRRECANGHRFSTQEVEYQATDAPSTSDQAAMISLAEGVSCEAAAKRMGLRSSSSTYVARKRILSQRGVEL